MITKGEIKREVFLSKSLTKRFLAQLQQLPEGRLYMKKERGYQRAYQRVGGKERYLNQRKTKIAIGLANRREVERAIKQLEENMELLAKMDREYTDIADLMPDFMGLEPESKAPLQKRAHLMARETLEEIASRWLADHNGNTDYRPEGRIHRTSDGIYVRSKSELSIYEYFKAHGIIFIYEKPVQMGDHVRYPDFTLIRKSDGKIFLWEHLGSMSDPSYFKTNIDKIYEYMVNGYLPFRDIIFTYDDEDGAIDLMEVDRILRGFGFIE